jgi:hypothetical protein
MSPSTAARNRLRKDLLYMEFTPLMFLYSILSEAIDGGVPLADLREYCADELVGRIPPAVGNQKADGTAMPSAQTEPLA